MSNGEEPDQYKVQMGERIAERREAAKLTQSDVARELKITPQAVQSWEAGKTTPRGKRLKRLAEVIKTTADYIQSASGDAAPRLSTLELRFLGLLRMLSDAAKKRLMHAALKEIGNDIDAEPAVLIQAPRVTVQKKRPRRGG